MAKISSFKKSFLSVRKKKKEYKITENARAPILTQEVWQLCCF